MLPVVVAHAVTTAAAPFACACGREVAAGAAVVDETFADREGSLRRRVVCADCARRRFTDTPAELACAHLAAFFAVLTPDLVADCARFDGHREDT